jgi:hypothetical protein
MTDTRARVLITAEDRASEVLRRLGSTVDKAQTSFERINAPLLRFQTLWASLVGGAVVAGFRSLVTAIDDLDESAQSLGTTASQLSNLRIAAGEAGVGAEALDTSLTRLNVKISDAASGNKEAAALFKALGVSIRDAAGNVRPTTDVLGDLANRFALLEDGPAKAALAVDVFGKAGARLLPLLNQGAAGLEKFSGLSEETVKEAAKLAAEVDKLTASWERFKFAVAATAIPAVNRLIGDDLQQQIEQLQQAIRGMEFTGTSDPKNLAAYKEQLKVLEQRSRAIAEGAKVQGAEAVQAVRSAQAVRDKVAADLAGEDAAKRKAAATRESSNAYAKEFADVARIRAARERLNQEQEDAANRERERRSQRAEDLTGRSTERQQAEDLAILREEFEKGNLEALEYEMRKAKVFGRGSEIEAGMERQTELAEQLGLTMASSLGELITAGGKASDIWKALGQDVLKLITQMLVLKPLAEKLKQTFEGWGLGGGSSGGGSGAGLFESLFKGVVGAFAGVAGGGTGQNANGSWGFVDSGRATITNVYIDGAIDRARIASYVETGVKAGLAQSWDNVARGGSGVLAG